jgi:hypothetical protein
MKARFMAMATQPWSTEGHRKPYLSIIKPLLVKGLSKVF